MDLEPIGDTTSVAAAPLKRRWRPSLFGDRRLSRWSNDEQPIVVSLFGDQTLDLRGARPGRLSIISFALFGDLDVEVDPGTRVELRGITLFGDTEEPRAPTAVSDGQLIVEISRYALFGDIEIEVDDD